MKGSLLARVVHVLEARQIPFALIGAAAMAAHGVSRATQDTDLFSVGPSVLEPAVWEALANDDVEVDVRHGDEDDPLLGVVRCTDGNDVLDVVVGRSKWQREIVARASSTHLPPLTIPIVTVEDLVLLKLYAGGIQDRWDIQQLLVSTNAAAVVPSVDARVSALPERCQELWRQLRPARRENA